MQSQATGIEANIPAKSVTFKKVTDVFASEDRAPLSEDLLNSAEVRSAVDQLAKLEGDANAAERLAKDHAAENSEAEQDVQRARDAADLAASGKAAVNQAARTGDKALVKSTVQRSLSSVSNAVSGAQRAAEDDDHPTAGTTSERAAMAADKKATEAAKKKAAASVKKPPHGDEHKEKKKKGAAGVIAHGDGDDDDLAKPKKSKAKPNYGVKFDTDDSAEEREEKKAKRAKRSKQTTVLKKGVAIAGATGILTEKKVETGYGVVGDMVNAETDKDFDDATTQFVKATKRNIWGDSFLEQEIGDAAGKLGKSADQIMARLRANGYIKGEKGWMWQREATEKWSHSNVQRLDFNGDKQISAAEIKFAMEHRYGERPSAKPVAAAAKPKFTAAEQAARNTLDTNDDGIVTEAELKAALRAAGRALAAFDKNKDGALNDAERVGLANALPSHYGKPRGKGK